MEGDVRNGGRGSVGGERREGRGERKKRGKMGRRKIKREGGMDERQDEDRVGRKGVAEKNHFEGVRERGWTERGSIIISIKC